MFYLWDYLESYLDIYKILVNYLSEYYSLNPPILLELIKSKGIDLEQGLTLIPVIHSGYLDIIVERKDGD